MDKQTYDEYTTKEFFKHLTKAYNKYEERDKAKEKLDSHIEKVKLLSLDKKTPQKKVSQEFKKLEKQILDIIYLERNMLIRGEHKNISEEVRERINQLEKRFDKYTDLVLERQKRVKEIEEKIKKRIGDSKKISLKNKLYDLEERYDELKEKGAAKSKLKLLEKRIKRSREKV